MLHLELRDSALKYAANRTLAMARRSPDRIDKLLKLSEYILPPGSRGKIRAVRQMHEEQVPAAQLIDRALEQVNDHAQECIIDNFIFNSTWGRGESRRKAWQEETGYFPAYAYLISPSMRCNLHCSGCYASEYRVDDDLPLEVIERVLNEAKTMGMHFVTVLGGEPFVRKDMWDVYARHDDLYFQVFTNGTTLTQANVDRLASLGNVAVAVSIEGWESETDDRRGQGTFAAIMEAFDRLREAGVVFGFSAMVTRYNIETICSDEFNQMLVDKGCLFGWHFLYMPIGREPSLDLMPTPEQRDYLRTHGASRIRRTFPMFVADFWNDAPYAGGCIAGGRQYFHINTNGDVEPCIFTHFATDNVKDKSLAECLDSPFFRAIRARQPYDQNLLLPCMLIDHPQVFRDVHAEMNPKPTHLGAEAIVGELAPGLDSYSCRTCAIMDRAWERDFANRGFVCPPSCRISSDTVAESPASVSHNGNGKEHQPWIPNDDGVSSTRQKLHSQPVRTLETKQVEERVAVPRE